MNLLVVHGTRCASAVAMIGQLAERVGALVKHTVRVAFVDVLGPTPAEVLSSAAATTRPAVVLPAFLSRGYHVRTDLPAHIAASGHPDVLVTPALGPSPQMVRIVGEQIVKSGCCQGDSVILAAAGTSDPVAHADLRITATLLSVVIGSRVGLAFAAGEPRVHEAVARARRQGAHRVVVASYLLAEGLFQDYLRTCGADVVTDPVGTNPGLVRLVATRFTRARRCRRQPFLNTERN
ncbi:sirohydrochlorin chelatase [Mycobacterium sp. SM1]|uniref:sirohydrochlorin chelatase n=1 Tax=Mycobacterium sp. SM1 TaxID=2816243 RepID=UPI001BCBAA0C|nr:sirohydrochlorin chelatase [Mycobacterium sp. SM1]MBS4728219.1 sirohydrochlorin chelatase [Mycobacterium sp. SM1]